MEKSRKFKTKMACIDDSKTNKRFKKSKTKDKTRKVEKKTRKQQIDKVNWEEKEGELLTGHR